MNVDLSVPFQTIGEPEDIPRRIVPYLIKWQHLADASISSLLITSTDDNVPLTIQSALDAQTRMDSHPKSLDLSIWYQLWTGTGITHFHEASLKEWCSHQVILTPPPFTPGAVTTIPLGLWYDDASDYPTRHPSITQNTLCLLQFLASNLGLPDLDRDTHFARLLEVWNDIHPSSEEQRQCEESDENSEKSITEYERHVELSIDHGENSTSRTVDSGGDVCLNTELGVKEVQGDIASQGTPEKADQVNIVRVENYGDKSAAVRAIELLHRRPLQTANITRLTVDEFQRPSLGSQQDYFLQAFDHEKHQPFMLQPAIEPDPNSSQPLTGSAKRRHILGIGERVSLKDHVKLIKLGWLKQKEWILYSDTQRYAHWQQNQISAHFHDSFGLSRPSRPVMMSKDLATVSSLSGIKVPDFIRHYAWQFRHGDGYGSADVRRISFHDGGSVTTFKATPSGTTMFVLLLHGEQSWLLSEGTDSNILHATISKNSGVPYNAGRKSITRVDLITGHGLLLPGGAVYSVYSSIPTTTLASRFLHDYNIPKQITTCRLEQRLEVDDTSVLADFVWLSWLATVDLVQRAGIHLNLVDYHLGELLPSDRPLPHPGDLEVLADFIDEEMKTVLANARERNLAVSFDQVLATTDLLRTRARAISSIKDG